MDNKDLYIWVQPWKSQGRGSLGATQMVNKSEYEKVIAERDQLAAKLSKLDHLATRFIEDSEEIAEQMVNLLNAQCVINMHTDDLAINSFAEAMKAKMSTSREKGRSGWDDPKQCSGEYLATLLVEHLTKCNEGTFEDIANFAMMLHQRNESPALLLAAVNSLKGSSGNELEALRDAIQACENQGHRVMYGNNQVTGAIISGDVIELVNE